jgi:DUF438 domain-containing protein
VPPEQVKEKFRHVLEGIDSLEIAKIEEELVNEGMKREEMRGLCEVRAHDRLDKHRLSDGEIAFLISGKPQRL